MSYLASAVLAVDELERVPPTEGVPLLRGEEELGSPAATTYTVCNVVMDLKRGASNQS